MAIQKIQASAQATKGFTLVELIVVITILVILGTIAFLNLGSFSAGARDSQRTSDLNQINTQVMTVQAKNGLAYSAMLSSGAANQLNAATISVGWTGGLVGTDYFAGDVNYAVLGIDSAKMKDPTATVAYKMGATTKAGGAYELAASLEETKTALVMGTYQPRGTGSTYQAAGSVAGTTLTLTSGMGMFKINDYLTGSISGGAQITAISGDLKTITISGTLSGATFTILKTEVGGLIAQSGSVSTPVTNKGTALPY